MQATKADTAAIVEADLKTTAAIKTRTKIFRSAIGGLCPCFKKNPGVARRWGP